ncbi:MAG: hypothetical protein M3Z33_11870 [Actinomycetota bacterium]|nr:hypothetical protein [Actinomycetota bacterium]
MDPIFLPLLLLLALVVGGIFLSGTGGALSSRRRKRSGDADLGVDSEAEGGPRPAHKVPHPKQTAREKGTLFPPRPS